MPDPATAIPAPTTTRTTAPAAAGPRRVVPVVASDWLATVLGRAWRHGEVVGVGPRAAYVAVTGTASLLAVEVHDAVGLPNGVGLPTDDDTLSTLRPGDVVRLDRAGLQVGPLRLAVRRWRRSHPTPGPVRGAALHARLAALAGMAPSPFVPVTLPPGWPAPDERLVRGLADLAAIVSGVVTAPAAVAARLDKLVGYGPGSTPSGDDLVAGFVATWLALAPAGDQRATPIVDHVALVAAARTTALSATLLSCAFDGAMARPAAAVVAALTAPETGSDPQRLRRALGDLGRIGHTSGRDLALGVLGAAGHLAAAAGPSAAAATSTDTVPISRSA